MGAKGVVSEVDEAGAIVSHDVGRSWDVSGERAVAVFALVVAGELAEVGRCAWCSHGPFLRARDGSDVVRHVCQGGVADREVASHHVQLTEPSSLLEVTVGDGARGVLDGGQIGTDVVGERSSPKVAVAGGRVKEHTAHASFGSVCGAEERRVLGHQFRQVSGAVAEAGS